MCLSLDCGKHLLQDLDLAEIRQLRARQRLFARDQSCAHLLFLYLLHSPHSDRPQTPAQRLRRCL